MWSYALEQWVHAVPTALTLFKPLGMFSFSEQVSFSKEFWGLYGDKECGPEGLMRKYTHAPFINFFKFKKKKRKEKVITHDSCKQEQLTIWAWLQGDPVVEKVEPASLYCENCH